MRAGTQTVALKLCLVLKDSDAAPTLRLLWLASTTTIGHHGPDPDEEVVQPGQPEPDEAYESDPETSSDILVSAPPHIMLTSAETANVQPPAFEDVCGPSPLPGYQQLEKFCSVLIDVGLTDEKLSLSTQQRNSILEAWNEVEEHDKQPEKFSQRYRTQWGNKLYCRTKRDDLVDAAVIQKVKMSKRYAPAQHNVSAQNNGLMYVLVKLLWLNAPQGSCSTSPEKKKKTS
ncbi:PREDICTED: uncharacterized protein LOC107086155 [Cyprinodon variegatus]|uniref:uncharacterized protein LOC107086155 n=1 Tax=Cyprinodon variegatus TaxID=28743 RepID=UPI0007426144|nr:PREDICTED: uncharacterized protein LOC107086155 [Cyprinodon variegatus]